MAGIRDLDSGASFARLKDLGCFDEEFTVYGYGYIEDGKISYLVGNSGEQIYKMYGDNVAKNIYTTPIEHLILRRQVSSGTMNDVNQEIKLQLAKQIKASYTKNYFSALNYFAQAKNSNTAYDLLCEVRDRVDGYFRPEEIQSFAGLCQMAYESKKINDAAFSEFGRWLEYAKNQLENDVILKEKFRVVMYGFAYKISGKINYFSNALFLNAHKKWHDLRSQGIVVTPLIAKEYWSKDIYQSKPAKDDFQKVLSKLFAENYLQIVESLQNYPGVFDKKEFASQWSKWNFVCNAKELGALKVYRHLFNM